MISVSIVSHGQGALVARPSRGSRCALRRHHRGAADDERSRVAAVRPDGVPIPAARTRQSRRQRGSGPTTTPRSANRGMSSSASSIPTSGCAPTRSASSRNGCEIRPLASPRRWSEAPLAASRTARAACRPRSRSCARRCSAAVGPDYEIGTADLHPDWVAGMFMLFRRETFAAVGGFDERYFLYYEDVDLCTRLALAGKRVVYCPRWKRFTTRAARAIAACDTSAFMSRACSGSFARPLSGAI